MVVDVIEGLEEGLEEGFEEDGFAVMVCGLFGASLG